MQTALQIIDAKINQIPNWLMGAIFGGLVYVLLNLSLFILLFIGSELDLDSFDLFFWLLMSIQMMGSKIGSMIGINSSIIGINSIIAGSLPFILCGGLFGVVQNKNGRILLLLILVTVCLAPVAYLFYFIFLAMLSG